MIQRPRRAIPVVAASTILLAAVAAMHQPEAPVQQLRVVLGLTDEQPSDWSGTVRVVDGEVTAITGWRFEEKDAVQQTSGWRCRTRNYIAPEERYPIQPPPDQPRRSAKLRPWPNGVTLTVRGAAPVVTLALPRGDVRFEAKEVRLGEPKSFLDGAVRVERLPTVSVLRPAAPPNTPDAVQDDYPAFWVRYRTNKHYLAWVAYQKGKDRVLLAEREGPDGAWSAPVEVAGPGDHFRVALANLHDDTLWVVWSSQRDGNWDLYGRPFRDGNLGPEMRLTSDPGPDVWHQMTTDGQGRAWLVWQGFRNGQSDIFARCADADGWHETVQVSTSSGDDWNPTITADTKEDRVWIGWDTYGSDYGIRIRGLRGGPKPQLDDIIQPDASTGSSGAHVSLTCDRDGRLWAAWDYLGDNWGKDAGYLYPNAGGSRLYQERSIRVRCLDGGRWREPAVPFHTYLPSDMKEFNELPQLQADGQGRVWMAFRHRTAKNPRSDGWAAQGRWDVYATAYLGDRWLAPIALPQSAGRNDMRASSQRDRQGNVYVAYASDNRAWLPPGMPPRNLHVAVARLGGAPNPAAPSLSTVIRQERRLRPAHPREKEQVARIRTYKVESGGRTYHIYRGDLHRHTDISQDGIGDGSLMDLHRYALDAAAFDFVMVGDHNMGQDNEYNWWRTQKANDLYTVPGHFISMYGYERSVPYPNGHRNVIWVERGHRTLPLPRPGIAKQMAEDTEKLYAYLRRTNGICTAHTSATGQGTDWREFDGTLEPFVELFQGFHGSYEAHDAPKAVTEKSDVIHTSFKPDGYIDRALAKGYRLGFQASSDHISTHVSYACVLAEEFSRKGLVEAMKKRHTYAATDNIVLDVRMGNLGIMGDEVRTDRPRLDVVVLGTGPLDRIEVIRDGAVVHTVRPNGEQARFTWADPSPKQGDQAVYYYVRVTQQDGQAAWGSPIWVVR